MNSDGNEDTCDWNVQFLEDMDRYSGCKQQMLAKWARASTVGGGAEGDR